MILGGGCLRIGKKADVYGKGRTQFDVDDPELAPFAHRFNPLWDHSYMGSKFQDQSLCAFTVTVEYVLYAHGRCILETRRRGGWAYNM